MCIYPEWMLYIIFSQWIENFSLICRRHLYGEELQIGTHGHKLSNAYEFSLVCHTWCKMGAAESSLEKGGGVLKDALGALRTPMQLDFTYFINANCFQIV